MPMKTARILAHLLYGSNGIAALTFAAVAVAPPDFPSPDGWSITSTGVPMSITDPGVVGMAQRFYRLEAAYP